MKKFKGLALAIISSTTFGFIPLFSIPLLRNGIELDSLCFYRFFFSSVMMGLFLLVKGVGLKVSWKEFGITVVISAFYAATSIFLTASYQYISSGIATTIHFLYPVIVAAMMILFFKEKLNTKKSAAILFAIMGVFLLCGGITGRIELNPKGFAFVLITVFTYATYIVGVNNSPVLMKMNGMKMTFYVLASSAFFFFCNVLVKGESFIPLQTGENWANALALAFLPTLISDLTLIYAIQMIGSTTTAILGCMEPLTAVIMGITFFKEKINFIQGLGMILVFFAVYLVIMAQNKSIPKNEN